MSEKMTFSEFFEQQTGRPMTQQEELQYMYLEFLEWSERNRYYAILLNGKQPDLLECYAPKVDIFETKVQTISGEDSYPTNQILLFKDRKERAKKLRKLRAKTEEWMFEEHDWGYDENYE